MIGRKIYYELLTGDIVLTIPEKSHENAIQTTTEQDIQLYDVLQYRDISTLGIIQLQYGEMRTEFEKSKSVKIDLNTNQLVFSYPEFTPSGYDIANEAKSKANNLEVELNNTKSELEITKNDNLTTLEACAELYELLLASQPI